MKTCRKCGIEKAREEFPPRAVSADGLRSECRACTNLLRSTYRKARPEQYKAKDAASRARNKERLRAKARARYAKEKDVLLERAKQYRLNNPGRASEIVTQWYKRNPLKRIAHNAVNSAIRKGIISRMPCVICGNPNSDGHHDDYTKPLDVIWLCKPHHAERHLMLKQKRETA